MNEDPQLAINEGRIRSDLYYRLAVFTINLPPLRERREDIIPLAISFLSTESVSMGKKIYDFSEKVRKILTHYDWPGNVRELKHVIVRAVLTTKSNERIITEDSLPKSLRYSCLEEKNDTTYTLPSQFTSLKQMTEDFERQVILKTLEKHCYNITKSAESLGMIRQGLQYKMKTLGINNIKN